MFRFPSQVATALITAALFISVLPAFGQAKKRITVMPFKDRTGSGARMNISEKVADAILSKLAETGQFIVVERESLTALQSEKNLKFDADFNPANAPKSGLLAVCDIVITGQIDEFSANQNATTSGVYIKKSTQLNGSTALKINARVTSVETGQIIASPTARAEKSGILGKSSTLTIIPNVDSSSSTASGDSALIKLVDSAIEEVAEEVSKKISTGAAFNIVSAPVLPKFVGMEGGLVVINKGTTSGMKIGDNFEVVRPTDTGLEDPDKPGQHIIRRKRLCTLVISSLEETISEGKCDGATPQKGDEIRAVAK